MNTANVVSDLFRARRPWQSCQILQPALKYDARQHSAASVMQGSTEPWLRHKCIVIAPHCKPVLQDLQVHMASTALQARITVRYGRPAGPGGT